MGSPKSDNICQKNKDNLTTSSCPAESTAAKESSIFGDMSNLSPVQPLKYAAILQGFPRIASPPYVLTSPNLNPQSSFLNRQQRCLTSSSGYSQDNVDLVKTDTILEDPEKANSKLCVAVECSDQKGSNATSLAQLQPLKTLIAGEDLLVARVDEESIDSGSREHKDASKTLESIMEKSDSMKDNNLASQPSTVLFKQADECSSGGIITGVNQMRDESHQLVSTSAVCSDHVAYQYINHANGRREGIDSLNEVSHAQSGILRRCLQFDDRQQKSFMESSGETTERQNSIPDLSQNFSPDTPYDRHMVDQFEFASAVSSPSCSSVTISKPRGIGLHLNSIVAGRPGDLVTRKQTSKGMVKLAGKTLILPGGVDALALSADNVERISSISESDVHVTEYAEIATPNKSLSLPDCAKPLDLPIQLSPAGEELAESTGEESNQEGSNTGRQALF